MKRWNVCINYRSLIDTAGRIYTTEADNSEQAILKVLRDENVNEDIWMIEVREVKR